VIAALVMLRPLRSGARRRGGSGVREGLRYAASRQQLWLPLVMMALVGLLAFNFPVILPVLASHTFHGNGGTYGLLTTLLSVGRGSAVSQHGMRGPERAAHTVLAQSDEPYRRAVRPGHAGQLADELGLTFCHVRPSSVVFQTVSACLLHAP
jgi:hypothetical protein